MLWHRHFVSGEITASDNMISQRNSVYAILKPGYRVHLAGNIITQ